MRYYLLSIMLLLYFFKTDAQCSVTKSTGNYSVVYINKPEEIYMNQDLENGLSQYLLRLVLQKHNDSKVPNSYMLECYYASSRSYSADWGIPPRTIKLRFADGGSLLTLTAVKFEETPSRNGTKIQTYSFSLEKSDVDAMRKKISGIVLLDHRKNTYVEAKPYHYLLREQVECLEASSDK